MTASVKTWLLGVACAAMLTAVAECLAPEGGVKRILKIAGGMVLLLAMVKPIVKLDWNALGEIADGYNRSALEYQDNLRETQDILYESIIAENTAAYISDKAKELGIICRVSVTIAWDGEIPCLQAVRIKGAWTAEQRELLRHFIESELGIPEAMQYFEETEP